MSINPTGKLSKKELQSITVNLKTTGLTELSKDYIVKFIERQSETIASLTEAIEAADDVIKAIGFCPCHEGFKGRGLTDPDCFYCSISGEIDDYLNKKNKTGCK
jgi:hypothetical protein